MTKATLFAAAAALSLCAAAPVLAAPTALAAASLAQAALPFEMKRYETDFVTIDLPEGMWFEDESSLGQISLYGTDDRLAFELFTVNAPTVEAHLEEEASSSVGFLKGFGWEERGRKTLGEGVLVTGMSGGTASTPNRPAALYVGPDGEGGVVALEVKTEFGTKVPPEELYAFAEAMARSMAVEELPDETSYAAFRSSQFGEVAEVPRKDGEVDVEALVTLTKGSVEAASAKAEAFAAAYERASREGWSPARVRADLIPLAQDAATEHRAMMTYAEAWSDVMAQGDPQAPSMRALGLVGRTGYSFLFDLAGHVTRVAELKEKGRTSELARFRGESAKAVEEERNLYAFALDAYAKGKEGGALPNAPRLADTERSQRAAEVTAAAEDMVSASKDPEKFAQKYAEADAARGLGAARASGSRRRGGVRNNYRSLNTNPAGLDPFSNVTVVRAYGGMSMDPWD